MGVYSIRVSDVAEKLMITLILSIKTDLIDFSECFIRGSHSSHQYPIGRQVIGWDDRGE